MPDPLVVQVMTQFKKNLLDSERAQQVQMAARWRQVENSLTDQVELFVRRVQQDGLTASQIRSRQFQLDRYQSLLAQVRVQLDAYTDYAAPLIESQQRIHAQQGIRHASQAITAVGVDNGVTISFETLPTSAVETMAGLAGDGSPLRDLLRDSYGSAADGMLNELTRATALGQNPVVTASRMIRNGLSQSLTRMLATARTEQLRVYRQSSLMTYRHSNVVSGYKRLATKDLRVCMACLMDDGHRYEVSEVMPEHVQGRCAMVPIVDGYKAATWQQGPDWFMAQSDANQRQLLGAGRYDAWKDGKFDLAQLVTRKSDSTWGDSVQETSLKDLLAGRGGQAAKAYDLSEGARVRAEIGNRLNALRAENVQLLDREIELTKQIRQATDKNLAEREGVDPDTEQRLIQAHFDFIRPLRQERAAVWERINMIAIDEQKAFLDVMALPKNAQSKIKLTETTTLDGKSTFAGKKGIADLRKNRDEAIDFVNQITAGLNRDVVMELNKTGRAYALPSRISIEMKEKTAIIVHELGHTIEFQRDAAYHAKRKAFFDDRTKNDKLERFVDAYPGSGYTEAEQFKRDKWMHAYTGKVYRDADSSEVIAMGIQHLYESPTNFLNKDPEFFDFMVSYLRGTL